MPYAEVAVDFRSAPGKTFSYSIPPDVAVLPGHVVEVPFGSRRLPGFVFELTAQPGFTETREITRVVDAKPWFSAAQLDLARWLSVTYFSPLYAAAALMVPPGFRQRVQAMYAASSTPSPTSLASMDEAQAAVLQFIQEQGTVSERSVLRRFGRKTAETALGQLVRRRLAVKTWAWAAPRVRERLVKQVELAIGAEEALAEAQRLGARAAKQRALLEALAGSGHGRLDLADAASLGGAAAARALEKRGFVRFGQRRVSRDPLAGRSYPATAPLPLTARQQEAWEQISAALDDGGAPPQAQRGRGGEVFLLHGVTGSGKTELYLRALEKAISQGGKGIVLVPEISLTPQTIERFSGRFPGGVAVLHSRLSPGEQFDEWWRVREGQADVVIGSRGAVFAPQPRLRLIVLDEEHEWTYKQADPAPRYHAREVAVKLAQLTGATVLLGSATPALESFAKARRREYRLLRLPERIGVAAPPGRRSSGQGEAGGEAALPKVRLVDMRRELREGNRSVFSRPLRAAIRAALDQRQQVLLFLNRRGAATFVQCRDCGHVLTCRRCSATMVYHSGATGVYHSEGPGHLRCHQCGYRIPPLQKCPECWGPQIRYVGMGTERLEAEVEKAFPEAVPLRWDSDVAQGRDTHEQIMRRLLDRKADILIGTQMIAKGLHLPGVTLVGVVNADIGLYAQDFRAGERVFQVLCQVAGRAGRGEEPGTVVVQTYSPEHYAIQAAVLHDYEGFFEEELGRRREAGLPPFNRVARLLFSHVNAARTKSEAERVAGLLKERLAEWAYPGVKLVGPAPAPLERLRGRYRWHLLVHAPEPLVLLDNMPLPDGWVVDVDPVGVL